MLNGESAVGHLHAPNCWSALVPVTMMITTIFIHPLHHFAGLNDSRSAVVAVAVFYSLCWKIKINATWQTRAHQWPLTDYVMCTATAGNVQQRQRLRYSIGNGALLWRTGGLRRLLDLHKRVFNFNLTSRFLIRFFLFSLLVALFSPRLFQLSARRVCIA